MKFYFIKSSTGPVFFFRVISFSEQFPLRGCLNPDFNSYYVTYVSQQGSNEEVIAESKTFRQLNPFLNILKLNIRNNKVEIDKLLVWFTNFSKNEM